MFMCTLSHHTEAEKSKNLNIHLHLIESAKSFYIAPTFLKIDDKIDCYYPPKIH